ncbi:hypothetical protein [Clostridium tetani]|uniref:hypothetical protein n=1 Tax=Clostridium tetani TaxID=1513 RepID=UPI000512ADDD|nr:hypothetical protein [Clostridium tetani]KGI42910.1 hypothetical protein KY55_08320 [Clostridium tetani]RXI67535.1 hypothetical protein DP127_14145 [Clostridium tetani]BDR76982.1 hypothetical protein K154306013_p10330 [Clostridium tetani]BDR88114.1 hypothetical protein N071400001_p10490 [Clostridium tetani]
MDERVLKDGVIRELFKHSPKAGMKEIRDTLEGYIELYSFALQLEKAILLRNIIEIADCMAYG